MNHLHLKITYCTQISTFLFLMQHATLASLAVLYNIYLGGQSAERGGNDAGLPMSPDRGELPAG